LRSVPLVVQSPVKKAKRKKWTDTQMESTMEAVRSGEGINQAARLHGVPSTTLKDRISGRVKHKTNSGPCKYLNVDEEKELATFLKESAAIGYGKSRKDVMNIIEAYAKSKGILRKDKVTQGWWREFVKR